jgi:hypothetical protein
MSAQVTTNNSNIQLPPIRQLSDGTRAREDAQLVEHFVTHSHAAHQPAHSRQQAENGSTSPPSTHRMNHEGSLPSISAMHLPKHDSQYQSNTTHNILPDRPSATFVEPTVTGQICRYVVLLEQERSTMSVSQTLTRSSNCGTTRTPFWRRSTNGETICNACGLYEKARNTSRPKNLKRPPTYTFTAGNRSPISGLPQLEPEPDSTTNVAKAVSREDSGSCPGGGRCNGTGGQSCCYGCPAYNNRVSVSKSAQLAISHTQT